MRRFLLVLADVVLGMSVALAASADGLQYQVPRGWVDLKNPDVEDSRIPRTLVEGARRGPFAVYAVDPGNLSPSGANASLNVIETRSPTAVTKSLLRNSAHEAEERARENGYAMELLDSNVIKLGDVDIGVTTSYMRGDTGSMRLKQYVIPGKEVTAMMTYACPTSQFARYEPLFDASAMETKGAYQHPRPRSFNFEEMFFAGGIGATAAALLAIFRKRKGGSSPQPAPVAAVAAPPVVWECAACKRRVPIRIDQCRCGEMRPA